MYEHFYKKKKHVRTHHVLWEIASLYPRLGKEYNYQKRKRTLIYKYGLGKEKIKDTWPTYIIFYDILID